MKTESINNQFYDELGDAWYLDKRHPIAILRAEQKAKNPWVLDRIQHVFGGRADLNILDIGCGAGFLTNSLGKKFDCVKGLDASASSLEVAKKYDDSKCVEYFHGDAYHLPFEDESMEVVCAMDFLEHVDDPRKVVAEASRVLKKGGMFFFHTFNRNPLAWLVVIKFMEWFVPNTPENVHCLELFIKPSELKLQMEEEGLAPAEWRGLRPSFDLAFWKSFFTREVRDDFSFVLSEGLALGYLGYALKS